MPSLFSGKVGLGMVMLGMTWMGVASGPAAEVRRLSRTSSAWATDTSAPLQVRFSKSGREPTSPSLT